MGSLLHLGLQAHYHALDLKGVYCLEHKAIIRLIGTGTQHNQMLLSRIQRRANFDITGARPSTPGVAFDVITGNPTITVLLGSNTVCPGVAQGTMCKSQNVSEVVLQFCVPPRINMQRML